MFVWNEWKQQKKLYFSSLLMTSSNFECNNKKKSSINFVIKIGKRWLLVNELLHKWLFECNTQSLRIRTDLIFLFCCWLDDDDKCCVDARSFTDMHFVFSDFFRGRQQLNMYIAVVNVMVCLFTCSFFVFRPVREVTRLITWNYSFCVRGRCRFCGVFVLLSIDDTRWMS